MVCSFLALLERKQTNDPLLGKLLRKRYDLLIWQLILWFELFLFLEVEFFCLQEFLEAHSGKNYLDTCHAFYISEILVFYPVLIFEKH